MLYLQFHILPQNLCGTWASTLPSCILLLERQKSNRGAGSSDSGNLSPELKCDIHSVEHPKTS